MTRLLGLSLVLLAAAPMGAAVLPAEAGQTARASQSNDEWCDDARRNNDRDRETFCEVREFTLGAGQVTAETSNGSVSVTGERRADILVRAIVVARARSAERAREIAREI
ncbi:MAG TPA: hypothetical protein VMN81_04515, partial [Vicinamibacterales bacterium]|nr:hypothetical protein [Vicinamibacterales bacterium]